MKIQLGEEAAMPSHSAAAALSSVLSLAALIAWKHLHHPTERHDATDLIISLMSLLFILPSVFFYIPA